MLQFYFLSILLNSITGFILLYSDREFPDLKSEGKITALITDETFRLVLGVLTSVTGFFKLLTAVRGDIPVFGDLLPALAGLAGGFTLLYEFYKSRSTIEHETIHPVLHKIVNSKRYVGIICLIASCFHFLFPTVLFL